MISIIMPAYNAENTIKESIQSVIKQTYANWELIIIDDCSQDGTIEIITRFLHDKRITLLKNKENSGVAKTRNIGIKSAKYEYIAFLDSDDIWANNKLEKQVEVIKTKHADFVFTAVKYIDNKNNR